MDDLLAFLRARLDEDEAAAKAATPGPWQTEPVVYGPADEGWGEPQYWDVTASDGDVVSHVMHEGGGAQRTDAEHIARHDPARALREVEAKRVLLRLHDVHSEPERWGDSHPDLAMRGQPTGGTSYWCEECDHDRDYGHISGPREGCTTLRLLATVYAGHPEYRPDWVP